MFSIFIQQEFRQMTRSPLAALLFLFLALCLGFGIWNGRQAVATRQTAIAKLLDKQQTDLLTGKSIADSVAQGLKKTPAQWWRSPLNPVAVGGIWRGGRTLAVEPAPLALLATGSSDLAGEAQHVNIVRIAQRSSSDFENPVNLLFGSFDVAFVVAFLLPLFVVALTFRLVSGEREQGTLALLLSQPQPVRRLFTLKMLARFALLGGLVLLLLLPMLLASGVSTEQAGVWQFVGLMLLYALFWFLFALAINLLGKNSQFNALACVGGWLLFAVVVPSLANLLAERLHPLPSRADYLNEMRDLEKTVEAKRAELVDQLYRDHPQMPRKAEGQEKTWSEEYREEMAVMDFEQGLRREVEARHDRAVERQADFLQSFAAWSPLLAAHEQMTELAGTSRRALQASQTQVRAEQSKWAAFFREKIDKGQDLTVADYHAIEQFPAQIRAAAQNSSSGWLWLLAQCAVAAGVVFWIGRHSRSSLAIS